MNVVFCGLTGLGNVALKKLIELKIDILNFKNYNIDRKKSIRKLTHIGMSLVLVIVVISFKYFANKNVIDSLLTVAGYTYGPLLGLFSFGIFTNYKINSKQIFFDLVK